MSAMFSLDQVLAWTESATSEYLTTSQCLSALLGRSGLFFLSISTAWREQGMPPFRPLRGRSLNHFSVDFLKN